MLVEQAEREAFLHFVKLNTALWSIEDSVLTIAADRVVLVDLLSHDVHQLIRSLYVGKILQRQFGCKMVGLIGNLLFSRTLGLRYNKQDAVLLARSFGVDDFLDLEEDELAGVPAGGFSAADTAAAIAQLQACPDSALSARLLSWRTQDGCRIGESIYETSLRIARNPFLTNIRETVYQVIAEAHRIHNLVSSACDARTIQAFTSGHMSYTQWGMTADVVLRKGGNAVWFDSTGNFSAYLLTRPPAGDETLDSQIRRIDKALFEQEFEEEHRLDPQFVAKVRKLFSSDFFLRPFWFEPAKSPPAALTPVLRTLALQKLGWPGDPRPVVCVFFHCLSDLPRDDEQIYLDYYDWIVETLKIAIRDTTKNWIFKTHPSNRGTYDVTNVTEQLKETYKGYPNIYFLEDELQKMELYSVCDLAVTVRGSISYEMSLFGKPALLAGRSVLSDLGFCHVADTAEQYEELLTTRFDTLKMTDEMQQRANFYLIYDKIICRLESTFMPYWTYQLTGNSSIWNALSERILYNISDLDPVASAIRKMFDGGPPRTLNPRFRELAAATPAAALKDISAKPEQTADVATLAVGDIVSFGVDGRGAPILLSKSTQVDGNGSWFSAERSAALGFFLSTEGTCQEACPLSIGLHLFIPTVGSRIDVSINGVLHPDQNTRGSGAGVHVVEFDPAQMEGNVYVVDIVVRDSEGRWLPFRLDGVQIAPAPTLRRYPEMRPFFGFRVEKDGDREFAWMPREVDFNLAPSLNGGTMRIAGYVPLSLHRQHGRIDKVQIEARMNGNLQKTIEASADTGFEMIIALDSAAAGDDGSIVVQLRANSAFRPAGEHRELSFIISEIEAS